MTPPRTVDGSPLTATCCDGRRRARFVYRRIRCDGVLSRRVGAGFRFRHHALTTAAFDRAFSSLDAALEAARPFYLHTCGARRLLDPERQPACLTGSGSRQRPERTRSRP